MELCIHILIVTYTNNSLTIKKYMHVTPKGWKMWLCLRFDQKWQKWPKLCSVLPYLGYVSDLESLKPFWERQGFSQWFGMESPLCVIVSHRRNTITSVWYYVSHRRDTSFLASFWHSKKYLWKVLSFELCKCIHFLNNV